MPTCSEGQCGFVCNPGKTLCAGECVDTAKDPKHCGGCGNVCAKGCKGGKCDH
jgi:hypothetical protein